MTTRSFRVTDLVVLPRLSAPLALAVGEQLLAVLATVPKKALSAAVKETAQELETQLAGLRTALATRLQVSDEASARALEADRVLDSAWGALHDTLTGFARSRGKRKEAAAKLQSLLFPEGLSFLTLSFKEEWAESQARLDAIAREGHALLAKLGLEDLLTELEVAHGTYGEALGLGSGAGAITPLPRVKEPLEAVVLALRWYVLSVATEARQADFAPLADKLLAPLAGVRTRRRNNNSDDSEAAPLDTSTSEVPS